MVRYQGVKKMASASRSKKLKRAPKAIDEIYDEINTPKWEEVRQRTRVKPLNEDLPGKLHQPVWCVHVLFLCDLRCGLYVRVVGALRRSFGALSCVLWRKSASARVGRGGALLILFIGLGQYYCMQCARHFISVTALETHNKSKSHKRRVRDLVRAAHAERSRAYTHLIRLFFS